MRVHGLIPLHRVTRPGDDRGAVAVIVAIAATTFLLMAAFAVDIANAYANARQLSVAADAASLAAAAKVGEAYVSTYPNDTCDPAKLATINAAQIAQDEADRYNTANNKTGVSEPVGPVSVTCKNGNRSIEVSIANDRAVKTELAGIIGIDSISPNSYAVARYQKSSVGGGLRPWAVCDTVVAQARDHPDTTYWTPLGNWNVKSGDAGICGTSAPGNWGSVDFDDGGNPATDLASWTLSGYPGSVTIPDPAIPADPGVSGSSALVNAFNYLVGKVVLFPSVTAISGTGQNATFKTVGVATVKICGIYYSNNVYNVDQTTGTQSDCWEDPTPNTTSTPQTSNITGVAMADNSNVVTTTVAGAFVPDMVGGTITVPNAGNTAGNQPLTGTIVSVAADGKSATLENGDKAKKAVTGVTAKVDWTLVEPVPGSLNVPVDQAGNVIDHIQFRWVNYTTNYSGPGGSVCDLDSAQCVGTTLLWR